MMYKFTAIIIKEGKWFVARSVELGVTTQGKSIEEAKKNLQEALELVLETNRILSRSELHSSKVIREPLIVTGS